MIFQSEIADVGGVRQVTFSGRLDSATYGDCEKSLQNLFDSPGTRAMIDFSALVYISSAGLRVVLMAAKRAKQNKGRLVLYGMQPHVQEVFEISGFMKILEVVNDCDAALARLNA